MKKHDIGKLNKLYSESDTCDNDVFAEMRSNLLLMSGKHYTKIERGLTRNLTRAGAAKNKRLRLVKNHTAKGISDVKDILASMSPGVMPYPRQKHERTHQRSAELAKAVWEDGKEKNDWAEFKDKTVDNFVEIGECCSKIYFNPIKGGLKGFSQRVELVNGEPTPLFIDANGELTPSPVDMLGNPHRMAQDKEKPIFRGQVVIERFAPFDLLRAKSAKSMKSSPYLIYRKMIEIGELKALVRSAKMSDEEKEEKLRMVTESGETTYNVFNGNSGSFEEAEGQVMLREYFFRQCPEYPKGYFYITVEGGVLFSGEIPFGEFGEIAFPIKWAGHDQFETSARGFSPIKRIRPAQVEVNRCASSISETQISVGWDKIVTQGGGKLERGMDMPGIRHYRVNGGQPTIIPGRSGDQFTGYLEHNISEIYRLLKIPENENPLAQAFDPKAELFKKQSQKVRFTKPSGKIEQYYKEVCETYLFLTQKYLSEEDLANILGPKDSVDLREFKDISRLDYRVKLEEVSGDVETMLGKSIELETILQYAGKSLDPETLKALLQQFPVLNKSSAFEDFTLDRENLESDILALERGEYRPAEPDDNHEYYIGKLTNRIKAKDFMDLSPEIQQAFLQKREEHRKALSKQQEEILRAQKGFIPSDGPLVKVDYYVAPDPSKPDSTERAVVPSNAVEWLLSQLKQQGMAQQRMQEVMNMNMLAQTASQLVPPEQDMMLQPQGDFPAI